MLDVVGEYEIPNAAFGQVAPSDVVPLNDGSGRLLLSNLGGPLNLLNPNGVGGFDVQLNPLLTTGGLFDQSGFTSVAVHPDFANEGAFGYGKVYTLSAERGASIGNNQFAEAGTPDFVGDPLGGEARLNSNLIVPNSGGQTGSSGRRLRVDLAPGQSQGSVSANFANGVDIGSEFNNPAVFHQDVIREWNLSELAANPGATSVSNPIPTRELYRTNRHGFVHSTVDIDFGPDGLLYIASGDGAPLERADIRLNPQRANDNLGAILRINPNPQAGGLVRFSSNDGANPLNANGAYSVPASNFFNGDDADERRFNPATDPNGTIAEVVALGLRSPYRLTIDQQTGDLFIGDVGQTAREEVSRVNLSTINAATSERTTPNFGWPYFEGDLANTVFQENGSSGSSRVDRVEVFNSSGVRIDQDYRLRLPGQPDQFFEEDPRNLQNLEGVTLVAPDGGGAEFTDQLVDPVFSLPRGLSNTVVGGFVYRGSAIPELQGRYVFADFGFGSGDSQVADLFYGDLDTGQFFRFDLSNSLEQFGDNALPPQITSIGQDEDGELLLLSGFEDPRGPNPFATPAQIIRLAPDTSDPPPPPPASVDPIATIVDNVTNNGSFEFTEPHNAPIALASGRRVANPAGSFFVGEGGERFDFEVFGGFGGINNTTVAHDGGLTAVANNGVTTIITSAVFDIPAEAEAGDFLELAAFVFNNGNDSGGSTGYLFELIIDGVASTVADFLLVQETPGNAEYEQRSGTFLLDGSEETVQYRFTLDNSAVPGENDQAAIDSITLLLFEGALDGDFNDDGFVNAADYTLVRDALGSPDEAIINNAGDGLNGVDPADYAVFVANFGASPAPPLASPAETVPEPSTLMLLSGSLLLAGCRGLRPAGRAVSRA